MTAGHFEFDAVPIGNYSVTVALDGFQQQQQTLMVKSETSPELHFELAIRPVSAKKTSSGDAGRGADRKRSRPLHCVSRAGYSSHARRRSNQQHGHDHRLTCPEPTWFTTCSTSAAATSSRWLIDGVPVPNTNIANNLGPQIDPKDLDYVEVQRGSYDAEYGDRTYGVFNAVPRTGFERDQRMRARAEFRQFLSIERSDQLRRPQQRLAYYGSLNGNRSDLGLETPVAADRSRCRERLRRIRLLIFNADPKNQLRWSVSAPAITSRCPFPRPVDVANGVIQNVRIQRCESQTVISTSPGFAPSATAGLLTVSPFYHFNSANYDSSPDDFPNAITDAPDLELRRDAGHRRRHGGS